MKKYQLEANLIAEKLRIRCTTEFIKTVEWRALRLAVVDTYGKKCMKCGVLPKRSRQVNVDHIKPRSRFPELALDFSNLQVLCHACNKRKGNRHCTDYRP